MLNRQDEEAEILHSRLNEWRLSNVLRCLEVASGLCYTSGRQLTGWFSSSVFPLPISAVPYSLPHPFYLLKPEDFQCCLLGILANFPFMKKIF